MHKAFMAKIREEMCQAGGLPTTQTIGMSISAPALCGMSTCLMRTQLPLAAAIALTANKAQGLTMKEAVEPSGGWGFSPTEAVANCSYCKAC